MLFQKAPAPLVIPAMIWIIGLCLGFFLKINLWVILLTISALILLFKYLKFKYLLSVMIILSCGMLRMRLAEMHPKNHISNLLNEPVNICISGRVTRVINQNYTYRCELSTINGHKCCGAIRLSGYYDLNEGDQINADIFLEKPEGNRNPGEKDWRLTWKVKKIYSLGKIIKLNDKVIHNPGIFQKIRKWIMRRLQNRLGNSFSQAAALLMGNTSSVDQEFKTFLRKAGLSHLFAISGLHVGIIAIALLTILKIFFKKRSSRNVLLVFLIIYGFLCNWSASVFRAVVMYVVYHFSKILERPVNFHQIVAVSVLIITVIEPMNVFSAGLQLSVVAVIAIYNLYFILEKVWVKNTFLNLIYSKLLTPMLVTFGIIIALSPITISTFGSFSANAVISVIPASLLIGIMLPLVLIIVIMPFCWQIFADAYYLVLFLFNRLLIFTSHLPFYSENLFLKNWQAILIYLSLLIVIQYIIRKRWIPVVIAILIIIITINPIWHRDIPQKGFLRITCLDCGQGDMAFIEFPNGKNALLDTGPPDGKGQAKNTLIPWLQKRRIKTINSVIITHAHNDHYGGVKNVFEALNIEAFIVNQSFWNDISDLSVEKTVLNEKCRVISLSDTMKLTTGNVKLRFIYPPENHPFTNVNNNSLVMLLNYNDFNALFTGDIEEEAETYLTEKYGNELKASFLKIPHHGSATSSTQNFIQCVDPKICFIPAGKNNRFGFPDPDVLKRYQYLKENLIIAAEDGAMILESDGKNIQKTVLLRN